MIMTISAEELKLQVDDYFRRVEEEGKFQIGVITYTEKKPTLTGLALFLGYSSTTSFKKYKENPKYADVIEYALLRIENRYEQLLQDGVTTAKIGLKRLGEWEDETVVTHKGTLADIISSINTERKTDDLPTVTVTGSGAIINPDGTVQTIS
jgi:hypothetical protein